MHYFDIFFSFGIQKQFNLTNFIYLLEYYILI